MKNKLTIHNDGINVYVTILVNSHLIGKIILSIIILFLIGLLIYIPATLEKEEISSFVFPIIVFGVFIFLVPVRYLFWNLYGKENLVINTKSISHFNDYGIYRTNLKTTKFSNFGTGFEFVRETDNIEFGNMVFVKYNDEDNLPEQIHVTSILIEKNSFELINNEISKIYELELNEEFNFLPFSEN